MTSDSLMDLTAILEAVSGALGDIVTKDRDLLSLQAHELALVHRFAVYLEERLREDLRKHKLTIDLDYDRHLDRQKWLPPRPDRTEDDPRRFRPDLIVHRRGRDTHNILVVEWKKNASDSVVESLEKRINLLLADNDEVPGGYGYVLGVLADSSDTCVRWRALGRSSPLDDWQVVPSS
jgi:hypothetical protein